MCPTEYFKFIIIKGAKSPERLLDEVTLFLHQVVSELPDQHQKMLTKSLNRDAVLENRHILVVEDDVRNVYALTSLFRSEEHTSELQSLMRISYAVFCLKKKNKKQINNNIQNSSK